MARPTVGITAREMERLLTRWGCALVRTKGGHSIWRTPSGEMIVTSAAGRRTDPVFSSVAQAARKLGTTVDGFLAGPSKHL
jgi:predicted RNA binding protein YcfA (HicA-like mRNA interferase family)